MSDATWQPIGTAPRDGTEVEVRNDRGKTWVDAYTVISGQEEGWPVSVIEWRPCGLIYAAPDADMQMLASLAHRIDF